jgi:hypothetical protein
MMGVRSNDDWSGTIVNGVTLGEPAVDEVTGVKHWDGGVPNGVLDSAGMFQPDGFLENGTKPPKEPIDKVADCKFKEPKPEGSRYLKGDILAVGDAIYVCNKNGTANLPPHKDWKAVKSKEVKEVK